jgi:hypothetical protein
MFPRRVLLPCLLFFLSQTSLTQQKSETGKHSAVPNTCPVTRFSDKPLCLHILILRNHIWVAHGLLQMVCG